MKFVLGLFTICCLIDKAIADYLLTASLDVTNNNKTSPFSVLAIL